MSDDQLSRTPGEGKKPTAQPIEADAPAEFGLVQAWWGDGKGKTTAALGMGLRAIGHGYRVHVLQFMKGGVSSVESVRGEYNAIAALPGFSYENLGHYGWHALNDGTDDRDHETEAVAGYERATELIETIREANLSQPLELDAPPEQGVHMLVLDELLYATERDLVAAADVIELIETKPDDLELVLTGGHERPDFLETHADLITHVEKDIHPFDSGYRGRQGTEY
ncbi:cob(I)yrinic acid a,c-diamide adenosyltransferase [Halocatena pleomorpha]|uniref:Cob(I)yrinic acid a,c-diamide adenosyltransferase n=1 Tax=Halocatena pleomorpha TaxID=1785090 RepID=A0A3P3RG24_9EURY|nr:cob(I)yrinic acid a,c-diamide adenosyltransferase [Halocatena pleomorpha]RRJ32476.1 cob(I)yrinic acid a,c-diamide adenosyltransferase [Halocatena pleomorpha]